MEQYLPYLYYAILFFIAVLLLNVVSVNGRPIGQTMIFFVIAVGIYYLVVKYAVPLVWPLPIKECMLIVGVVLIGKIVAMLVNKETTKKKPVPEVLPFDLYYNKGRRKIRFTNPYLGFMIYGGAGAGKTFFIGKHLLEAYMKAHFSILLYDFKDFDYARTAFYLRERTGYSLPIYYINFTNLNKTHRFNVLKPSVIKNENYFIQIIDDLFNNLRSKDSKQDEWYNGGLGIFKGVAYTLFKDFPEYCTLSHLMLLLVNSSAETLTMILENNPKSRALAAAFLASAGSPKTQASYMSTMMNYISQIAFNDDILYVLSGDDFDFNLIEQPKMVCISNTHQVQSAVAPICAMMVTIASKQLVFGNSTPLAFILDEFNTIGRIANFESMPSTLRQYKASFMLSTQSSSKIEETYNKSQKNSIEANFSNRFFGRTNDSEDIKTFPLYFPKVIEKRYTYSSNSGSGGNSSSGRSIAHQKESKYEPSFFTNMKTGEFVGIANEANVNEFRSLFVPFQEPNQDPIPDVKDVTEADKKAVLKQINTDLSVIMAVYSQ